MSEKSLWQAVLGELQVSVSSTNYRFWFKPTFITKVEQVEDNRQIVTIATPNPFIRDTIEDRYYGQIKQILDRVSKKKNELVFVVKQTDKDKKTQPVDQGPLFQKAKKQAKAKNHLIKKALRGSRLKPELTFENFAVSSTNEMAHAAAQAVAERPGQAYHLLFFYGGVGVGKTHLMQAVGHRIIQRDPEFSLVYCTGEEFTNEIIEAIRKKTTDKFRKKYRPAQALLIDDIQFIAGKDTVQEEFFHTFNAIQREGGQIIMTSDKLPEEIEGLEARLRSRFEGGLMVDIQEPNFELRTAILLIKAQSFGVELPMDVAQLIAANVESTRRLEGTLMRLVTESQARSEPITPDSAQALLGRVKNQKPTLQTATPKQILNAVAQYYDLKPGQLKGKRRLKNLADARHLAMYMIRTKLETPYTQIGQEFGNRDHTTVMHAVDKITEELSNSEKLRLDLNSISKKVFGTN